MICSKTFSQQLSLSNMATPEFMGRGNTGIALIGEEIGTFINPGVLPSLPHKNFYFLKVGFQIDPYIYKNMNIIKKNSEALADNALYNQPISQSLISEVSKLTDDWAYGQTGIGLFEFARPNFAFSVWQFNQVGSKISYSEETKKAVVSDNGQNVYGLIISFGKNIVKTKQYEINSGFSLLYSRIASRTSKTLQTEEHFHSLLNRIIMKEIIKSASWENLVSTTLGFHVYFIKLKFGLGAVVANPVSSLDNKPLKRSTDFGVFYSPSRYFNFMLDYGKFYTPGNKKRRALRAGTSINLNWFRIHVGYNGKYSSSGVAIMGKVFVLNYNFIIYEPDSQFGGDKRLAHFISIGLRRLYD